MADDINQAFVQSLIDIVNEISSMGENVKVYRRDCAHLIRRMKLIVPLFEELRDLHDALSKEGLASLKTLGSVMKNAKQLIHVCHSGCRIYLFLDRENVLQRFHAISTDLARALDDLPFSFLDISDEVREQVDLVLAQLKRAKGRVDTLEVQLHEDITNALSRNFNGEMDQIILERFANNLQIKTLADLKQEAEAFHNLSLGNDGKNEKLVEWFTCILDILKETSVIDNGEANAPVEMASISVGITPEKLNSSIVPDDFRCPISLEIMKDPVIVATGQTYDRVSIQKWLDAGHKTCPKTQQLLPHLSLTPNYVLRSLISQWCENNGVELPKMIGGPSKIGKPTGHTADISCGERTTVDVLVQKLASGQLDVQRAAAGELRLLAKRNVENRICIAEAGAIPLLVKLLSTNDTRAQEHAVTALLNLSINDNNKGKIVLAGAIDPIVEVLKSGSMEARENAAATLFSLSVVDANKITIGASGAIPALVELLREGTSRGKKDAATALFNLSIYQGNKGRAVRAGVVPHIVNLLMDNNVGMVDESLAILAILATHQEGRTAISQADAVSTLVALIRTGSPRNKENAAAVLVALCTSDIKHLVASKELGVHEYLVDLCQNGTPRGRRKAASLLEHLSQL